jgi:hypothetical protein
VTLSSGGLISLVRKSSVASGRFDDDVFDVGDNLAFALLGGTWLGEGLPEVGDEFWWMGGVGIGGRVAVDDVGTRCVSRFTVLRELKAGLGLLYVRIYLGGIIPFGHPSFGG